MILEQIKSVNYMQKKLGNNVVMSTGTQLAKATLRKKKTPLFNEDLFDF